MVNAILVLDPEDRCPGVAGARSREQRDKQLSTPALDPHRLLDSERPDAGRGARDDPLSGEALRAGLTCRGYGVTEACGTPRR